MIKPLIDPVITVCQYESAICDKLTYSLQFMSNTFWYIFVDFIYFFENVKKIL